MFKFSKKIKNNCHTNVDACCQLLDLNTSDESEAEEIEIHLYKDVAVVEGFRYGDINPVPKQSVWLNEVLPSYDEGRFKEVTRLSYAQFNKVYLIIKDSNVFDIGGTYKNQTPVTVQLAIVLFRLGTYGNGASIKNISKLFGISDGSSITRFTRRVIKALIEMEHRFIYWPDEKERSQIVIETSDYLPQCVGFVDGVKIELDEAPHIDKEAYFDGKKDYSINTQLVCDPKKMIRQYVVGYPDSCHDFRIWNECNLSKNPDQFSSNEEWIGGDKGYPLRKNLMTPMKESYKKVSPSLKKKFKKYFSKHRVSIEHVNGALKETFESLKGLRLKITNKSGHVAAVRWIKCCLILYNITQPFDNWTQGDTEDCNAHNDKEENNNDLTDDFSAQDKRLALLDFVVGKT